MSRFRDAFVFKAPVVTKVTPIDLSSLKVIVPTAEPVFQFKPLVPTAGATAPVIVTDVQTSASQGAASASVSVSASGSGSSSVSASAFAYVAPDGSSSASASASASSGGVDRFVFKSASFPTVEATPFDNVALPAPVADVPQPSFQFGSFAAPTIDWTIDIL